MELPPLWLVFIGFPVLLVLLSFVFTLFSSSISFFSESRLKNLADDGNKMAKRLLKIKSNQLDLSIKAGCASIGLLCTAVLLSTYFFSTMPSIFSFIAVRLIVPEFTIGSVNGLTLIDTLISFIVCGTLATTFGYSLPKRIALSNPEKYLFSKVLSYKAMKPMISFFSFIPFYLTRFLLRIGRVDPDKFPEGVTEDEIRMMVDASNESGNIELSEREMINNVFDFDERIVGDIMTHRTDLSAVSKNDTLQEVIDLACEDGFSRIPVYDEDIDNIVGIIYVKDLLALAGSATLEGESLEKYMRATIYVPESSRCRELFKRFKAEKVHFAVVVDEYGGTAGVVTMEDLVESIVGDIQDEYDTEDEEIVKLDEDTYLLFGGLMLEDVERVFDIEFDEDEDSDTLGGLVLNALGRIPSENENPVVTVGNIEYRVELVEERRIVKVLAHRLNSEDIDDEDEK